MPGAARSQADTIPIALQGKIVSSLPFMENGISQFEYFHSDEAYPKGLILASSSQYYYQGPWGGGYLFFSTDGGKSFFSYDSSENDAKYLIAHTERALYRFIPVDSPVYNLGKFQVSYDLGRHWSTPDSSVFGLSLVAMGIDPNGDRVVLPFETANGDTIFSFINYANSPKTNIYVDPPLINESGISPTDVNSWADSLHGALHFQHLSSAGADIYRFILTSDGGKTWHNGVSYSGPNAALLQQITRLDYPFPGLLIAYSFYSGEFPILVSRDNGMTWVEDDTLPLFIHYITPARWIGESNSNIPYRDNFYLTLDSGRTWKPLNVPTGFSTIISFSDSLNGLACDGADITARTTDGGVTWQPIDSSTYMLGRITPALGIDSEYYAFGLAYKIVFFSADRGLTWQIADSNAVGYAFAGLDSDYWIGGTGFVTLKQLYGGKSITLFLTDRDSTRITPIDDHFVWVSNGNELYAVSYNGLNVSWLHAAVADNIPGYDSSNSYTFFPITRSVAYARTPDTLYVTTDGGSTWSLAASMPDRALDPEHWFQFTADTSQLRYTVDGGRSFRMIVVPGNAHALFPIDSQLWYANGFYTTDAGSSWNRIPGWNNKLGLYPVDRTTAFGQPFANNLSAVQVLWRLDLPSSSSGSQGIVESPKAVSSDCSVYPNPTTGVVTIRVPASVGMTAGAVTVTNLLGETVLTANPNASTPQPPPTPLRSAGGGVTLDLSGLPAGTYFVRFPSAVAGQPTVVVRKILKE